MAFLRYLLGGVSGVEKWTLAGFVIGASLIFSVFLLASEVAEGETRAFDERILLLFRVPGDLSVPIGPSWVKEAMRDITALGSTSVLTIVVGGAAAFLAVSGARKAAVMVLLSVLSGVLLSSSLKVGFSRARPNLVPYDAVTYTASFPSGHATLSAVVYFTLGALLCRTQSSVAVKAWILSFAAFLTVIVGTSRVYLGVHWPTDVIAGWLIGATWALLCWFIMLWLQSRGEVEPELPSGAE
jgi:undecaprenyl-diphosphatase